jgi:hypothetical protein
MSAEQGEWRCSQCGISNRRNRLACRNNGCGAPRIVSASSSASTGSVSSQKRPTQQLSSYSIPTTPTQVEEPNRKFIDAVFKNGQASPAVALKSERDAIRFVTGLSQIASDADLLARFADAGNRKLLMHALSCADSAEYYNVAFVPLLERFARDEMALGPRKRLVVGALTVIFDAPLAFKALVEAMSAGRVAKTLPVCWFVLQLACADSEALGARVRESDLVTQLLVLLETSAVSCGDTQLVNGCSALRNMIGGRVASSAAPATVATRRRDVSLAALQDVAGGRHCNDFVDFRSIVLLPCVEEVMCEREPYLPPDSLDVLLTLERQFRLLRHDFVGPLRDEVRALAGVGSYDARLKKRLQRRTFTNVAFTEVLAPERGESCVRVEFSQPSKFASKATDAERLKEWKAETRLLQRL